VRGSRRWRGDSRREAALRHRRHQYRRQQGHSRRAADYVACIEALSAHVAFLTVNVSSPNTPGLRNLQQAAALDDLLSRVIDARERAAESAPRRPLLLKIAPDLTLTDLDDVVGVARRHRIDGMVVGNTTVGRANLRETEKAKEQGGLSGVRCSRSRPAYWPKPTCAPRARSR